ncbi:hypothetical protein ACFSJY_07915 [Thalassotalea euphylliae]|uniref:hypothetical protein n=1 Tax=Thalassotalea euphylliae TaxID=1655234 RepID=UPI003640F754
MRKLLTAPTKMALSDIESQQYQNMLKHVTELSLNLMAVKVEHHPEDFLGWCYTFHDICQNKVNRELLDEAQFKPLKKLEDLLANAISCYQLKTLRVAPWPIFAAYIEQNAEKQSLHERLALLDYVSQLQRQPFSQLNIEDRLVIAGKHTASHAPESYPFDIEWFGSTKSNKAFMALVSQHAEQLDDVINCIPLEGDVTLADYQAFVAGYKQAFNAVDPEASPTLTPATRLLTMRRPDVFVCLTTAKFEIFANGLNCARLNNQSFEDYWQQLVLPLQHMAWLRSDEPELEAEQRLWKYRSALVDVFLFADQDQANQSNFIRLRDKPKTVKAVSPRAGKRSKASAEQLVDQALENPELPEFIHNMRGTLIKSVQSGKTVDQAINLMKSIFS